MVGSIGLVDITVSVASRSFCTSAVRCAMPPPIERPITCALSISSASRIATSPVFHDAWEGAVHSEGCVGLTVRTALHATHRQLRLVTLQEPFTLPIDLVWRDDTGTLRPAVKAIVEVTRDLRETARWAS